MKNTLPVVIHKFAIIEKDFKCISIKIFTSIFIA